jgi:hypothetical protein
MIFFSNELAFIAINPSKIQTILSWKLVAILLFGFWGLDMYETQSDVGGI